MKRRLATISGLLLSLALSVTVLLVAPKVQAATSTASCKPKGSFLGLPTWYKYLDGQRDEQKVSGESIGEVCRPVLSGISDVWLVVAAVVEIMLRIAVLVAIGFVVVGGVYYMSSQGQPDKTKKAQQTIINAVIGLVIAIASAAVVSFVARQFK